jgi:hypothetical protein
MRLHEVWEAFRKGRPIESKKLGVWMRFSNDDPHYGGDCIYDKDGYYDNISSIELKWLDADADDWVIVKDNNKKIFMALWSDGKYTISEDGTAPSRISFGAREPDFHLVDTRTIEWEVTDET